MPDLIKRTPGPEAVPTARPCLNDDEILDFAGGRISTDQLDSVHSHLDGCLVCQRLVTEAVREKSISSAGDEREQARWSPTFQSGSVIARRYRVQRFVARGGMGEVYDAYDRDLQKRIALKTVISTVTDGPRAVRRLKAEVQLAHRVSHPNVCRIYDLGTHDVEGGGVLHFLTMEFVDGERLSDRLQRGALPVADSTHIARQILSGLRAAHGAGILHRDLKSDNVMLRPASNGQVIPVIVDFGLARTMDVEAHRTTSASGFVGTPCYMAHEQLENGELTPASDVYAFGVIWFEMLTGHLPFSVRAPFERLRKPAPRPSSLSADVPASFDKLVLKCLERLPEQRFGSPEEVLAALDVLEAKNSSSRVSVVPPRRASRAVVPALIGALAVAALVFARFRNVSPAAAASGPVTAPTNAPAPPARPALPLVVAGTPPAEPPPKAEESPSIAVAPAPATEKAGPAKKRPSTASSEPELGSVDPSTRVVVSPPPQSAAAPPSLGSPSVASLPNPASVAVLPMPGSNSMASLPPSDSNAVTPAPRVAQVPAPAAPTARPASSAAPLSPERMGFADPFRKR